MFSDRWQSLETEQLTSEFKRHLHSLNYPHPFLICPCLHPESRCSSVGSKESTAGAIFQQAHNRDALEVSMSYACLQKDLISALIGGLENK